MIAMAQPLQQPLHLTLDSRGTDQPRAATLWASLYHDMGAGRPSDSTSRLGLGLASKIGPVLQVVASAR